MATMKLKKRSAQAAPEAEAEPAPASPRHTAGKGRPTPKRSQARAARAKRGSAVLGPATTPKEARRQAREERRRQSQEYREAMLSGDVRRLPPRERAPERVLARDIVDTRFNAGPFFLVAAAIYFVGTLVPIAAVQFLSLFVMLTGLLAVIIDAFVLSRRVGRAVAAAYPDSRVRVRMYAVQRSLLPRRWRLPRPRLSRDDLPPDRTA